MALDYYIHSEGKRLRCGYTTGTCAALAASGAATLLLTGSVPPFMGIRTPKGIWVECEMLDLQRNTDCASAAVAKDAGDDCDVTDGLRIYATVAKAPEPGILIQGGEGVGTVTKPGLDQPVGAAAINSVPRTMITQAVERVCREAGYTGGLTVAISIPGGAKAAEKTFNPHMGIVGGLSILGTSGIVEPMSREALTDTIALELGQARALGHHRVILTPGNYGLDFLTAQGWDALGVPVVRCSNFIGFAIDEAGIQGFSHVLLVGHAGKLVKLAGGIFNTHSRTADCRMELLCAHAALSGAGADLCRQVMDCVTCDAAHDLLAQAGLWDAVADSLTQAICRQITHRAGAQVTAGAVFFSNRSGLWGMTQEAQEMIAQWTSKQASSTP